mgnify:CR=1 FL=1
MKTRLLLFESYPKIRNQVARIRHKITIPLSASKLKNHQEKDIFIKNLPVLNCAGRFCLNPEFVEAIKHVDIFNSDIRVNRFTKKIKIKDQELLSKCVNEFSKVVPEFYSIFRPKSDEVDLGKHTLATFKNIVQHKDYKGLSKREKNVLNVVALGHDIIKSVDAGPMHPVISAQLMKKRLESQQMFESDIELAVKLITHHHYSENILKGRKTYSDYADIFDQEEFHLLKILIDSDIRAKRNFKSSRLVENAVFFEEQDRVFAQSILA